MNLAKLPLSFCSAPTNRSFVAYPSTDRPRWLWPADGSLRRTSLSLYAPQKPSGVALKQFLVWGWLPGEPASIMGIDLLITQLSEVLEHADLRLAFSIGTPGAYQKVTAQVMSSDGDILAYAKIANQPLAQKALKAERHTLKKLQRVEMLRSHVPQVLMWTQWRDTDVLLMTPGPRRLGPKRFGASHVDFLRKLHAVSTTESLFGDSPIWQRQKEVYNEIAPYLPSKWTMRYERLFELLKDKICIIELPASLAHGDFAPWNTRTNDDGSLYIFDWEGAIEGAPPLFDIFHFLALSRAVRGKSFNVNRLPFRDKQMKSLHHRSLVQLLYLNYLLHMSLYYSDARIKVPHQGDDHILRWYGKQIDARLKEMKNGLA